MKFKRRRFEDDEPIPTASMADITFLLIIFFIVSTVLAVDRGLNVELPQTEVSEKVSLRELIISVSGEGKIYTDGNQIALSDLGAYVKSKRAINPSRTVVVRGDRRVSYGTVADIMDELIKAGVNDVALPTIAEIGENGR